MLQSYVAVIERNSKGRFFAHLPDLPGATAAGATVSEVLRNLSDIAADHLADLANDGDEIPEPTDYEAVPHDPEVKEFARAFVTVEAPGRSVKISLSIDEGLLARIDQAASKAGLTRSGFFAEASYRRLREEVVGIIAQGDAMAAVGPVSIVGASGGADSMIEALQGKKVFVSSGVHLAPSRFAGGGEPMGFYGGGEPLHHYGIVAGNDGRLYLAPESNNLQPARAREATTGAFIKVSNKSRTRTSESGERKR